MGVKAIETNWQKQVLGKTDSTLMQNLAAKLGFSGKATKIGRIRPSKKIHEAVVAVPFIVENSRKKFFRLDEEKVNIYKTAVRNGSDTLFNSLITGDPQSQIGRTLLKQMQNLGEHLPKDKTEEWMRYPPAHVEKAMREADAPPLKMDTEIGLTFAQLLLPMFFFMFLLAIASSM